MIGQGHNGEAILPDAALLRFPARAVQDEASVS